MNLYAMNEFRDYYYGYMMPDTGDLKYFALYLYQGGIVLQMPLKDEPEKVPLFVPKDKLFRVLSESVRWGDQQGIDTVGALNDMITQDDMREIVLVQEAFQERKIGEIAKQIADMTGRKTRSAQAVGGAVGHNPISIIIPCHRVVGTNGSLTGYAGGIDKKIALLKLEGVDMDGLFVPKKGTAL